MRLYCTLIDKCGWYQDYIANKPFICEECGSLALPWINSRLEEDGTTVPIMRNTHNSKNLGVEHNSVGEITKNPNTSN